MWNSKGRSGYGDQTILGNYDDWAGLSPNGIKIYKKEDFINDAGYAVKPTVNGAREYCPYYTRWAAVKRRCVAVEYKDKNPTYKDVTICEAWLTFSNFKAWMQTQYWQGLDLDKDILVPGNKIYSPETCRFIPHSINSVLKLPAMRGGFPLGVHYAEDTKCKSISNKRNYIAQCNGEGKSYIGAYDTPNKAHIAWQEKKAAQIEKLLWEYSVEKYFDMDVGDALLYRIWNLRLEASQGIETKRL